MSMARPWRKWLVVTLLVFAVALLAIPLGWAVLSRDMPELQPWHTRRAPIGVHRGRREPNASRWPTT